METNNNKLKLLNDAVVILKQEYVGLDKVIDDIVYMMRPWHILSSIQQKPLIINLWGPTGVGKTSLIKRLFELIKLEEKLVKFDSSYFMTSSLKDHLVYDLTQITETESCIIIDEFQHARTKNHEGHELDERGMSVLWEILDTGKFDYDCQEYSITLVKNILKDLKDCRDAGVDGKKGFITHKKDVFQKITGSDKDDEYNILRSDMQRTVFELITIRPALVEKYGNYVSYLKYVENLDLNKTIIFLEEIFNMTSMPVPFDLSKSLIFVIGNVDGAYTHALSTNQDDHANDLAEEVVTIGSIKKALLTRFRHEQVSRLGNNHIIYPMLSKNDFETLINRSISKVKESLFNGIKVDIKVDKSVNRLIYQQAVIPAHGARPVISSARSFVEAPVIRAYADYLAENETAAISTIEISYLKSTKTYVLILTTEKNEVKTYKYKAFLLLDRKDVDTINDERICTAVHEAGHAIISSLIGKIIPERILSVTMDESNGYGGFVQTKFPTSTVSTIKSEIAMLMGGYAAEELVFGRDNLSAGASYDILQATTLASRYVRDWGMSCHPVNYKPSRLAEEEVVEDQNVSHEIEALIVRSLIVAKECLQTNRILLSEMSDVLCKKKDLNKKQIKKIIIEYNSIGADENYFKDYKDYYGFKDKLKEFKNVS
jgi:hypothetical protein